MRLKQIFKRFRGKFIFTMALVLIEAGLEILYPLFIGLAINDAMNFEYTGAWLLGGLGVAFFIVGASRRYYDSRFYAQVFEQLGAEIGVQKRLSASQKSARIGMLRELVEFLENSIPDLVTNSIGLVGVLAILFALNQKIFLGCLVLLVLVFFVYWLSSKKTTRFNRAFNDESERQVDVLNSGEAPKLRLHLKQLMKWNIRLSDLETLNFSVAWLLLMGFLVLSIIWAVGDAGTTYGAIFAVVMYVFQFIENIIALPFFYQQSLRLSEILSRLNEIEEVETVEEEGVTEKEASEPE